MWDRSFRQRAYIGLTRSRMRWYVRKDFITQRKISDVPIRRARNSILDYQRIDQYSTKNWQQSEHFFLN